MKRMLILASFLFFCMACAATPTKKNLEMANYGLCPEKYEDLIRAHYSTILFDPYSAVYTFCKPVKAWHRVKNEFGWVVCGSVNGKNRLGAYVGVDPFYFMIKNNQVVVSHDHMPPFVGGLCRGSGASECR